MISQCLPVVYTAHLGPLGSVMWPEVVVLTPSLVPAFCSVLFDWDMMPRHNSLIPFEVAQCCWCKVQINGSQTGVATRDILGSYPGIQADVKARQDVTTIYSSLRTKTSFACTGQFFFVELDVHTNVYSQWTTTVEPKSWFSIRSPWCFLSCRYGCGSPKTDPSRRSCSSAWPVVPRVVRCPLRRLIGRAASTGTSTTICGFLDGNVSAQ
jgi:hypothetical protein